MIVGPEKKILDELEKAPPTDPLGAALSAHSTARTSSQ